MLGFYDLLILLIFDTTAIPEFLCVGKKLVLYVGEDLNHLRDDDRPQESHVYSWHRQVNCDFSRISSVFHSERSSEFAMSGGSAQRPLVNELKKDGFAQHSLSRPLE
jgi:hypothetical protein